MSKTITFCEEDQECTVTEITPQPLCAAYEHPPKSRAIQDTKVDLVPPNNTCMHIIVFRFYIIIISLIQFTNHLGIRTSGYLNPAYCSDENASLIAFTALLGNTTLTDCPSQPQHHRVSCR